GIAAADVPNALPMMEETLGVAYLHKAGMDNGVFIRPGELCLFPPRGAVAYRDPASSEKAVQYLLKFLEAKPNDLEGRWMLNLAYMTLGRYPGGVPEKF